MIEKSEEDLETALYLIYEVLDANKVPVSAGISACLNIFLNVLVKEGVKKEKIFEITALLKEVIISIGGKADIIRESFREE